MATTYTRCRYISPTTSQQCETHFPMAEGGVRYCAIHVSCASPLMAASPLAQAASKELYIDSVNSARKFAESMSLDELDIHIAKIESAIEAEKTKLFATRAVKQQKLDGLSEEQRAERKKHVITSSLETAAKTKPASKKLDPIKELTKVGISSSDLSDLIAQFKARKSGNA